MNSPLILRLVGLRYKLLWAQTRTRNGRIALFFAGYLLALLILMLLTAGGYGAAMVAVRSGKAETVAQAVLGGLFLNALFTSVVTGFGINTAFTDGALRRYALSARERLAARHLTGILEPIWIFVLGLYLGLSTGMYVFGAGAFWLGAVAVLLLLIADYLLARVLATLIEWLAHVRGGTAILFPAAICPVHPARIDFAPAGARQRIQASGPGRAGVLAAVRGGRAGGEYQRRPVLEFATLLAAWIAGLLVVLMAVERQAARPRSVAAAAVTWDNRYERVASIFGPAMAPLVGRSLRYYCVRKGAFQLDLGHSGDGPAHLHRRRSRWARALFRARAGMLRGCRFSGHCHDVDQSVRLRFFRFPALLSAARGAGRDPARQQLHGAVLGTCWLPLSLLSGWLFAPVPF